MKGGKGGEGRKRSSVRVVAKDKPRAGPVKKGAPKRDWGAMPKDEVATPGKLPAKLPAKLPTKPTA